MKKTCLFLIFCCFATLSLAQIGITSRYVKNNQPTWELNGSSEGTGSVVLAESGYAVGLDYWFRLKNYRIEFSPELNYAWFSESLAGGPDLQYQYFSLFVNTNFYFLDFTGDCDCPTFSKQGTFLDKGLFLQLSPGLSSINVSIDEPDRKDLFNEIVPSIGFGLGFDLGVSDLLTITPMFGGRFYFGPKWEDMKDYEFTTDQGTYSFASDQGNLFQWFAGIRLGLRFNE